MAWIMSWYGSSAFSGAVKGFLKSPTPTMIGIDWPAIFAVWCISIMLNFNCEICEQF